MMINIDYPLHFDNRGRTGTVETKEHIYNLVSQFLFTSPGERVNRPDFGAGLLQRVFEPNSYELAAVLEQTIKGGLQAWLNDLIEIESLVVASDEATIQITLSYRTRTTQEYRTETIYQARTVTP